MVEDRRHHSSPSLLRDLSPEECADLLAAADIGRVSVLVAGRPEIFPVFFVYDPDEGSVSFPAHPASHLHSVLDWPYTAFEIDDVVPGECGWSVLVQGHAEEITDDDEIDRLSARRCVGWQGGSTSRWIKIVPSSTTGRSLSSFEPPRATPSTIDLT